MCWWHFFSSVTSLAYPFSLGDSNLSLKAYVVISTEKGLFLVKRGMRKGKVEKSRIKHGCATHKGSERGDVFWNDTFGPGKPISSAGPVFQAIGRRTQGDGKERETCTGGSIPP